LASKGYKCKGVFGIGVQVAPEGSDYLFVERLLHFPGPALAAIRYSDLNSHEIIRTFDALRNMAREISEQTREREIGDRTFKD